MRTYQCVCGNVLFSENTRCLACNRELGYCPVCRHLSALLLNADGSLSCGNPECGAALAKCFNYSQHQVCNRCVPLPANPGALCDCCRFNATVPDLSVQGNWQKWQRLEAAKRQLFYDLNQLGLPYGTAADGIEPSLSFAFMADPSAGPSQWRPVGNAEQVFTGHADGRITINIREADDAERERLRVNLGEPQRTLVGHFRHEIGHYYWDQLVKGRREDECRAVFGDHDHPTYAEALEHYYQAGPPADWAKSYISAYATMHPWEDFAETWATYLDMAAALDTAEHNGFGGVDNLFEAPLEPMLERYKRLGIALNELNRTMGLLDAVPDLFVPPVVEKLRYIHRLVQAGRAENGALHTSAKQEQAVVA
jgi:hypothetical protein